MAFTKQQQLDDGGNKDKAKFQADNRRRSDRFGGNGLKLRDAMYEFIEKEGVEFMRRRNDTVMHPSKMDTGTACMKVEIIPSIIPSRVAIARIMLHPYLFPWTIHLLPLSAVIAMSPPLRAWSSAVPCRVSLKLRHGSKTRC